MRAAAGDRIIVKGHRVGEPDRDGEVLSVGPDGAPPFRILWSDNGHETIFFPGSDVQVHHYEHDPSSDCSATEKGR